MNAAGEQPGNNFSSRLIVSIHQRRNIYFRILHNLSAQEIRLAIVFIAIIYLCISTS